MRKKVIGFLGCGNIGSGVWDLLNNFAGEIAHRNGIQIVVKKMLVRDLNKKRPPSVPRELLTTNPDDILNDPEITLIAEFMGGEEPATQYMIRALENGKTVVTANKMAMALNWHHIQAAAVKNRAGLYYEASVCGALPIIRAMTDSLQANRIQVMMGIINGTTNYILTRMSENGEDYLPVLEDAKRLGLAEPDPTSDVEGYDAAYKLSILSSLAFHARVPFQCIHREGISGVTARDIAFGKELGYTVKLLAIAKREENTIDVRVHPTFIPCSHPLASVSGSLNAVYLHGHACQEMMLLGRGAGNAPTASAVVSDMLYAFAHETPVYPGFENTETLSPVLRLTDDWSCGFYIRLSAVDQPGVLGHITTRFGEHSVGISSLMQRNADLSGDVPIVVITHKAFEKDVRKAIASIDPSLAKVESLIRVER